jgi:hypothetical protein
MPETLPDGAAGTATATATAPIVLPNLDWHPTNASGSRGGVAVERVVVHRWGVAYSNEQAEAQAYQGVINFFSDPAHEASAHVVFPGSAVPGEATQMVPWDEMAWAEAAYNPSSDDVESADAIWLGHDPLGMAVLARIVAARLNARGLPAVWSAERGFCRHADLGVQGGDHLSCPTTNIALWKAFVALVEHEATRGGFRADWGR